MQGTAVAADAGRGRGQPAAVAVGGGMPSGGDVATVPGSKPRGQQQQARPVLAEVNNAPPPAMLRVVQLGWVGGRGGRRSP